AGTHCESEGESRQGRKKSIEYALVVLEMMATQTQVLHEIGVEALAAANAARTLAADTAAPTTECPDMSRRLAWDQCWSICGWFFRPCRDLRLASHIGPSVETLGYCLPSLAGLPCRHRFLSWLWGQKINPVHTRKAI